MARTAEIDVANKIVGEFERFISQVEKQRGSKLDRVEVDRLYDLWAEIVEYAVKRTNKLSAR